MQRFLSKKEFVFIVGIIVVCLITLLFIYTGKSKTVKAQVTYDGKVIEIIDLEHDGLYQIDALLPVTLKVTDGKICFINSVCPNHDCEGFGLINKPPQAAICLPARVSVQIIEVQN